MQIILYIIIIIIYYYNKYCRVFLLFIFFSFFNKINYLLFVFIFTYLRLSALDILQWLQTNSRKQTKRKSCIAAGCIKYNREEKKTNIIHRKRINNICFHLPLQTHNTTTKGLYLKQHITQTMTEKTEASKDREEN